MTWRIFLVQYKKKTFGPTPEKRWIYLRGWGGEMIASVACSLVSVAGFFFFFSTAIRENRRCKDIFMIFFGRTFGATNNDPLLARM